MTLVERLDIIAGVEHRKGNDVTADVLHESARRIAALEASALAYAERRTSDAFRISRLEAALREAHEWLDRGQNDHDPNWWKYGTHARVILRDALNAENTASAPRSESGQ